MLWVEEIEVNAVTNPALSGLAKLSDLVLGGYLCDVTIGYKIQMDMAGLAIVVDDPVILRGGKLSLQGRLEGIASTSGQRQK